MRSGVSGVSAKCTSNGDSASSMAPMIAAAADRQGERLRVDPLSASADPNLPFEPASSSR